MGFAQSLIGVNLKPRPFNWCPRSSSPSPLGRGCHALRPRTSSPPPPSPQGPSPASSAPREQGWRMAQEEGC